MNHNKITNNNNLPLASIGSPVNNIFNACLRFTARASATAGVEQNNPMRTLTKKTNRKQKNI